MFIRILFSMATLFLSSCALLSPRYMAEGLQVHVIHKDQFERQTETKLQTQIVQGTIHDNVPTTYTYPAMNLVQLRTIDGKIYYVDVDIVTFNEMKHNQIVISGHWKIISNLPDFKYAIKDR